MSDELRPGLRIVIDRETHATVRGILTPAEFADALPAPQAENFRRKARERHVTHVAILDVQSAMTPGVTAWASMMLANYGWSDMAGGKLIIDVIGEPPEPPC